MRMISATARSTLRIMIVAFARECGARHEYRGCNRRIGQRDCGAGAGACLARRCRAGRSRALDAAFIPATIRDINRALILAAGHGADEDEFDWEPLARTAQPLVLYMVMHNLERVANALIRGGRDARTPTAVIAGATTPAERI